MDNTIQTEKAQIKEDFLVFETPFEAPFLVILLCILIVSVFLSSLSLKNLVPKKRYFLIFLRLMFAGGLFFILLEANCQSRYSKSLKNTVLVTIDISKSMEQNDKDASTRLERAFKAAQRIIKEVNEAQAQRNTVKVLTVAENVSAFPMNKMSSFSVFQKQIKEMALKRNQSDLLAIVDYAAQEKNCSGVVIISDGADSHGLNVPFTKEQQRRLQSLSIPIHTVFVGTEGIYKDIALTELRADPFAFVHNELKVEVMVKQSGFDGREVELGLSQDGVLIARKKVKLSGEENQKFPISVKVKEAGLHVYTVNIPVLKGEEIESNNQKSQTIKVIRDRMRVLLVAGHPSWDVRFMRQMLKENPSVDLITFFILRSVTDKARASNQELSLIPFPTKELFTEQLNTFDVVIFQDFNFQPYHMSSYLKNIHEFVVKNGGGFLMIGGSLTFSEAGYQNTLIADLLPVELAPAKNSMDIQDFHPLLTKSGKEHPILDIEELSSSEKIKKLPNLNGINLVASVKEDSQVLLAHPFINADQKSHPVLAIREVGEGRTASLMTDSLWKWALPSVATGSKGDLQRQVIANTLRWLIKDPQLSRIQIELSEDKIFEKEDFGLSILSLDSDYQAQQGTEVAVSIESITNKNSVQKFNGQTSASGYYKTESKDLSPGIYKVKATSQSTSGQKSKAETVFIVHPLASEAGFIVPNKKILEEMSNLTSASAFNVSTVDSFDSDDLKWIDHKAMTMLKQESKPFWNMWYLMCALVAIAALEWILRRQSGLR